jgi:hypothetical protein
MHANFTGTANFRDTANMKRNIMGNRFLTVSNATSLIRLALDNRFISVNSVQEHEGENVNAKSNITQRPSA